MLNAIIQFSLRNRLLIICVAIGVVVLGSLVAKSLPIDVLPNLTRPRVVLVTACEGLAPEEVEQLLVFHMQWLHAQGLQPDGVVDRTQDIDETVVVTEDSLTAYLLGESERTNVDLLDDVDAVHVVEAHLAYFEAIGAVGPQAPLDDVL